MWMWTPPSSTIRRDSAAYSRGVYGIAGHWSRLAIAPEIAQVITAGSSSVTPGLPAVGAFDHICGRPARSDRSASPRSDRHHSVSLPGPLDALVRGHLERPADRG